MNNVVTIRVKELRKYNMEEPSKEKFWLDEKGKKNQPGTIKRWNVLLKYLRQRWGIQENLISRDQYGSGSDKIVGIFPSGGFVVTRY